MPTPSAITDLLSGDIVAAARALVGATLLVDGVGGRIVETEAYHFEEPASHSFRGPTPRNGAMFLGPGHVYVYRSYGIHWCLNFTGVAGTAVLIRAIEPGTGVAAMQLRRGVVEPRLLASGPGRLCMALGIDRSHDGRRIDIPPFNIALPDLPQPLLAGPRIGITRAADLPWRFGLAGSRFLSRAFPRRPADIDGT